MITFCYYSVLTWARCLLIAFLLLVVQIPLVATPIGGERVAHSITPRNATLPTTHWGTVQNPTLRIEAAVPETLFRFRGKPDGTFPSVLPTHATYLTINPSVFDTLSPQPQTPFEISEFWLNTESKPITLVLQRFEVLATGFRTVAGTENGDSTFAPEKHLLFAGTVREIPGAHVYIAVFRTYCTGYIELPQSGAAKADRYLIAPLAIGDAASTMVVYRESEGKVQSPQRALCKADELAQLMGKQVEKPRQPTQRTKGEKERVLSTETLLAAIAVECDYEYYVDHTSNLSRAANYAVSVMGAVSAIYYRDMNIRLQIPYLRVWTTTDPYPGGSSGLLLSQLQNYWNNNMSGVSRVLTHLLSGVNGIGGVAYVDALCELGYDYGVSGLDNDMSFPYTGYVWDIDVTAHELGHNFSSLHTHSCTWAPAIDSCYFAEEGSCFSSRVDRVGTIMSYCHLELGKNLVFHPRVATKIRNTTENTACIPTESASVANDVAVVAITEPVNGASMATSATFAPTVVFRNNGTLNKSSLTATCSIANSSGTQVYSSTHTISTLNAGASVLVTFASISIATTGTHAVTSSIALVGDSYTANNTMVRPFAITSSVSGSVGVIAPNTAATLTAGSTATITWTKSGVSIVRIEFSADDGATWETVHSTNADTSYSWTVPSIATTQGRIRISDRENTAVNDISDAAFTILLVHDLQPIQFVTPVANGSAAIPFAPAVAIRNNGSASHANVSVRLRVVRFSANQEVYTSLSTIASIAAHSIDTVSFAQFTTSASGVYVWYAHVLLSGDQNSANDSLARTSSITIPPTTITVTSPNGGEQWNAGTVATISWTSTGFLTSVKIEYSTNNTVSWTTITSATSNTGAYLWTVPNLSSSQMRIRISNASNTATNDISNAVFEIVALQPPSGVAAVGSNNQVLLSWTASASSGVTAYRVYRGTSTASLAMLTDVTSSQVSLVDTTVTNCTVYYYAVSARSSSAESVQSTTVHATPSTTVSLSLLLPSGGEVWQAGTSTSILWSSTGCIAAVDMEYSTTDGNTWSTIATAIGNSGSYLWQIPNTPSTTARIRISQTGNPLVSSTSAVLSIVAVAPPTLLSVTRANSVLHVSWLASTSASISSYEVYRKVDGGAFSFFATTSASATSYDDTQTTSNTLYSYAVRTIVNATPSSLSDSLSFAYVIPTITANGPLSFCTGNTVVLDVGSGYSAYLWSNGATTQSIVVAQSGTYSVTVTGAGGSMASTSTSVTVYPLPIASITPSGSTTFCAGGSVVLDAGSGFASYLWSNGATTQSITVSTTGTYTVVVGNANGCTASSSAVVTVHALPVASITPSGSTEFCSGGSVVLDAGSGFTSYAWSNGATTQSITVSTTGTYTIVVSNASGCTASSSAVVIVHALPVASITPSGATTFCAGGSVMLDAGSGFTSYLWSNGATTQSITVGTSGTYTVVVGNASGCTASSSAVVVVHALPVASITPSGSTEFCSGGSVMLDAGSGFTSYLWSNGATTQSITISTSGTYTVVVSNASGCTASSSAVVTVHALPVASITPSGSTEFCAGGSVVLDAGSGFTSYLWSNGATTQSITVGTSGTYTVVVSNASGCTASSSAVVVVHALPVASITPSGSTEFCAGGSVVLDAGSGFTSYAWSNGATTQSITISTSGTYTVVVSNASGCTASSSAVVTVHALPVASITPSGATTFCTGGSVVLDAGSGFTSYLWSNGATTQSITVGTSGTYTVVVSNASGCTASSSAVVVVHALPVASITPSGSTEFCSGGSVVLDAGSGFTSYAWSNGATTQSIAVGTSGTYTVVVSNANGCTASSSAVVTVHALPVASITPNGSTSFCTGGSVVLDAGSGFTSYAWSNGATTQSIAVGTSGTYTVVVSNASGCTASSSAVVTVHALPVASITPSGSTTFCAGGSVVLDAGSGFTSYAWSNGATTQSIAVGTSGTYTVVVSNTSGCTASSSAVVTVHALPVASITPGGSTALCAGGSVVLDAGSGFASYLWSNGATTQSITVGTSGTYTVVVSNANGCSASSSAVVVVHALPVASITPSGSTTFCAGGSVVLDAGSGFASYLWSNGATTQSIAVGTTGTYTVVVGNANGCTAAATIATTVYPMPNGAIAGATHVCGLSSSVVYSVNNNAASFSWSITGGSITSSTTGASIVVDWGSGTTGSLTVAIASVQGCILTSTEHISIANTPEPAISSSGPTAFCTGGSVVLDAGSGFVSYLWSNGATTQTVTVVEAGTYSVEVAAAGGCSATTAVSVSVLPAVASPVILADGSTAFCAGGSVVLDAGSGFASYVWSNGATTQSITVGTTGTYSVVVSNVSGCTASSSAVVTVYPLPIANIAPSGSTAFCAGGSVVLDAGSGFASYLWSNGATTQSIAVGTGGTYTVVVSNASGCTAASSAVVTVYPLPIASIAPSGSTEFCSGGNVVLDAGNGFASYLWSNGATTHSIAVATSGTYSVVVSNASGCTAASSAVVAVHPLPVASIAPSGSTTFCAGGSVVLDAGSGFASYLWSNGATTQAITVGESGAYSVAVAGSGGCTTVSSTVAVVVYPTPDVVASPDTTLCAGYSVQLLATGATTYTWQPSVGLSNPFLPNPIASPATTTTYIVTGRNAQDCSASDTVTIVVQPFAVAIRVLLEGAYVADTVMSTALQMQNFLPLQQPYNTSPWWYNGTEQVASLPASTVDWVLVEFRSVADSSLSVARRAALLRSDGAITDIDGSFPLVLPPSVLQPASYFVVVRHRNHLAVMSRTAINLSPSCALSHVLYTSQEQAYNAFQLPMLQLAPGMYGMVGGDATSDGIVSAPDRVGVRNRSGQVGYLQSDVSLDGIVNAVDRVLARNRTFRVSQVP